MKTNVMRRLDQAKIPYADFEYDTSEGITQGTRPVSYTHLTLPTILLV